MTNHRKLILLQFRLQPLKNESSGIKSLDFDLLDWWLESTDRLQQAVEKNAPAVFSAFKIIWKEHRNIIDTHNTLVDQVNELKATVQEKKSGVQRLKGIINYQQGKIEYLQTLTHMFALPSPPVSLLTGAVAATPSPPPAGTSTGVAATPPSPMPMPTMPTSIFSMKEKKSIKIPNPEVFSNRVKKSQFEY